MLILNKSRQFVAPLHRVFQPRLFATKKFFTPEHEWIEVDEGTGIGTVGITDYAQQALGDVVYVEVPQVGKKVAKKNSIGAVESVKAASDIYAPVSGEIIEANDELSSEPTLINASPEGKGWIAKLKLTDSQEVTKLLNSSQYKAHCEKGSK